MQNVATATPAAIDAEIARISGELNTAVGAIEAATKLQERFDGADFVPERLQLPLANAATTISDANNEIVRLNVELNQLDGEYRRRGGWTRYYLVNNTTGHVHSSTACSTCNIHTSFLWLTDDSGRPAEDLVEDAAERACTTCFPWAPVDTLKRESKYQSTGEVEAAAKRAEREQKHRDAAAKRAAAAITAPDGSPLRGDHSEPVRTERDAQSQYTEAAALIILFRDEEEQRINRPKSQTPEEHQAWVDGRLESLVPGAQRLLEALAYKRETTVDEQRAELAKKVQGKVRAFRKETAEFRSRNPGFYAVQEV